MHKKYLATGSKVQLHHQCPGVWSVTLTTCADDQRVSIHSVIAGQTSLQCDVLCIQTYQEVQHCYAQPSTVFMISHPIHHFHQPPCTAQPVLHCTGCTVYSTPWVITSLPAGHCLVGIYYLLYFTQSTLYNQIHSGCRFLEITIILESLSIDRVGRFWVVAKIWETFTCLSRHWFLEHEYIVKSTPSR